MQDYGETLGFRFHQHQIITHPYLQVLGITKPQKKFLNYGSLGNGLLMINLPNCGNNYGKDLGRLVESEQAKCEFLHECRNYSQNFAHFIESSLGRRYALAENIIPPIQNLPGAIALHPKTGKVAA